MTSVVTVNHSNVDVRAAAAATSTAPKRATRQAGAMCATCKRRLDVTECSACHTKVHGSQRDGGEMETVDRRGQDHARYAKVTSDVKKGYKRGGERAGRGKRRRGRRDGGERGPEGAETGARGGETGSGERARTGREEGERREEGGERGREGARGARGGERGVRG